MRMRPERQAAIAWPIGLRAVMVEKQERVELLEPGPGQRPPRDQIADIVAQGGMPAPNGSYGQAALSRKRFNPSKCAPTRR
jgi:hypothetical protein